MRLALISNAMNELRRLFRLLRDNPARIAEGPGWAKRKLHVWYKSRRGPSGYVTKQSAHIRFESSRPRYDHLRILVRGGVAKFPETVAEKLPSPDEGIDIVFSGREALPSPVLKRVSVANGFQCVETVSGWHCVSSSTRTKVEVTSRPSVDLAHFNPIGRTVDTALIGDAGGSPALTPDELRQLAAVRIPMSLPPDTQVCEALKALACGTPVAVDQGSSVVSVLNGAGVVVVPDAAPLTVGRLGFDQPFAYERASTDAHRLAFWGHSTEAVADEYIRRLGFRVERHPSVSILLLTRRPHLVLEALGFVSRQNYANFEVVVGIHGAGEDSLLTDRIREACPHVSSVRYFDPGWPFGEVLDELVDTCGGRLVAKFDDDDWYSPHHLGDLVAGWILTRADVVGKTANFAYLEASDRTLGYDDELQYRRVEHIPGGTMLAPRDVLVDYRFGRSTRAIDSVLLRKIRADGGYLYSTTRQGFMRRRHKGHTAGFDDDWFVRRAHGRTLPGLRLDLAGVNPVQKSHATGDVHSR